MGTAGCDQGKRPLGVAPPQDLKRDGDDRFPAAVTQAVLKREETMWDTGISLRVPLLCGATERVARAF